MCSNNRFISNSFNNNMNNSDDALTTGYSGLPANLRYGNAYVPVQVLRNIYTPQERT